MSLPHSIRASPHRKHCTESQTTGNLTGDTHTYSLAVVYCESGSAEGI